jgi:hypothetical protein
MEPGEYQWVWQSERAQFEADGWRVVGARSQSHALLHGPDRVELLMFREVEAASHA